MNADKKLSVLLEMRPALDGYAGIPQETRLLFRGLCMMDSVEVEGLLQTSLRFLASGTNEKRDLAATGNAAQDESSRLNRYSRVVISLDSKPSTNPLEMAKLYWRRRREAFALTLSSLLAPGWRKVKTTVFEPLGFEAFIWQSLFAKTLPASDFSLVTSQGYRVCAVPWNVMQSAGLNSLKFVSQAVFPKLSTHGTDVFIAQTPYPGRVAEDTALVVRYHDALPIFMPHAFANKSRHQATHFHALASNVRSGAYFACVSESTRQDLLRIFPELAERAVTIHNMVSPCFFDEASPASTVPDIIRARISLQSAAARPAFTSLTEQEAFYQRNLYAQPVKYLLMVATIEPRKNHVRLLAGWETIRTELDPSIKLVIVGNQGWDVEPIMQGMRSWIDQGALFVLNNVPAADLRVLYRHAAATVCPSIAEGFDFSGVEAMCSGGIAIASDIAVHHEVYANAAEYFDPYCTESLVGALKRVLYDPTAPQLQEELRKHGREVSPRYSPERLLPKWKLFLNQVVNRKLVPPQPSSVIAIAPHVAPEIATQSA